MANKQQEEKVSEAMLDELLAGRDPREVFDSGDLFRDLKKALVERIPDAEMDAHMEGEQARGEPNRRNGHNRKRVIPFLAFSENVRKAVYTTNQVESLNSSLRRAVRRRGHFPGDDAARKLLYLALRDIAARWRGPPAYWPEAKREFAIQFGERFRILD